MALINGLLNLGTALSGMTVITPPSGAGYASLPISYDSASNGISLSTVNCAFGPVQGSWGTLSAFGVTDLAGNPAWAGTLAEPLTPSDGELVLVPVGQIQLTLGAQYHVTPSSNWFAQPPILGSNALAGNPGATLGGIQAISVGSGIMFSGSAVGLNGGALSNSPSGLINGLPWNNGGTLSWASASVSPYPKPTYASLTVVGSGSIFPTPALSSADQTPATTAFVSGVLAPVATKANGAIPSSAIGVSGGVAPLDSGSRVPLANVPSALTGLSSVGVTSGNKLFVDTGLTRGWWYDASNTVSRFSVGGTNMFGITDSGSISIGGGNASLSVGGAFTASTATLTGVSAGNSGTINKGTATGVLQYAISATANLAGAASGKNAYLAYMTVPSDTMSTVGATLGSTGGMLALNGQFGGPGALGTRSGFLISYAMQGVNTSGVNTVAGSFWVFSSFNAGGTDTNAGCRGLLYGLNPQILLQSGATNYQLVNGLGEIDLAIQAGASSRDKLFGSFIHLATDAVQGASTDAFLLFGAQQGFSAGTKLGFSVGSHDGPWPMDPVGTWEGTTVQLFAGSADRTQFFPPRRLFAGTDYSDVNFTMSSGYAFRSPGFAVDGLGQAAVSNAAIGITSTGISLDVPNQRSTGVTIAAGGGGGGSGLDDYYVGDIISDIYGGRYLVTAIASGAPTALTVLNYAVAASPPANPVSTYGASGTGLTLNISWAARNVLSLNPSGGPVVLSQSTPASATAAGITGQIAIDANFIYVCAATNTWKRQAVATW